MKVLVVLFALFSAWNIAGANTGEFIRLKLTNHNFQVSHSEMQKMIKRAGLESHGYIKEVTSTLVKEPVSGKKDFQKSFFYYKIVSCSKIQEIEKELDTLMPGSFGDEVATKLREEIDTRHLNNMGQCKVGLEVVSQELLKIPNGIKTGAKRRRRQEKGCVTYNIFEFHDSFNNNGNNNNNNNNNNNDNNNSNNNNNNNNDNNNNNNDNNNNNSNNNNNNNDNDDGDDSDSDDGDDSDSDDGDDSDSDDGGFFWGRSR